MKSLTIDIAKTLIRRHEGLRLKPYQCTAGKTTIGYGRNLDDVGITQEEADALLDYDLARVLQEAAQLDFWHSLDDVRQAAIADMLFNLGLSRFLGFHNMLAAMRVADYEKAAVEMLDSRWAKQVGSRAVRLAAMIRTGTNHA